MYNSGSCEKRQVEPPPIVAIVMGVKVCSECRMSMQKKQMTLSVLQHLVEDFVVQVYIHPANEAGEEWFAGIVRGFHVGVD